MKKLLLVLVLVVVSSVILLGAAGCSSSGTEGTTTTSGDGETAGGKPFYEDRTITLICAFPPGGGYDSYARLVAKNMEEYLPGSTIIVKNVPQAGSIVGTNEIYRAEPDGLTFGTFARGLPFSQVAGQEGVEFDLAKMSWLGSPATSTYTLFVTDEFKSIEDVATADDVKLTAGGVGDTNYIVPMLVKEMTGWNIDVLTGWVGGERDLAMQRGEVAGRFGSWSGLDELTESGVGHPIMFVGKRPAGYEEVPVLQDVVKGEEYQSVVSILGAITELGRPFAGPPGIPEDRLSILREAFDNAVQDPKFIDQASAMGLQPDLVNYARAEELIESALGLSPQMVELLKAVYAP